MIKESSWVTPERQALLARIAEDSDCKCVLHCNALECKQRTPYQKFVITLKSSSEYVQQSYIARDGQVQQRDVPVTLDVIQPDNTHADCITCAYQYENYIEALVEEWREDVRLERIEKTRLEREQESYAPDKVGYDSQHGSKRFDPVSRSVFLHSQPQYYIEAKGVGHRLQRVALVRVPSTDRSLWIDLPKKLSKGARKRLAKHGIMPNEDGLIARCVRDFQANPTRMT